MKPLVNRWCFIFKSFIVPYILAKHPPLSISETSNTGEFTFSASNILAISYFAILISAGEPAPSISIISFFSIKFFKAFNTIGKPFAKTNSE
jgi:hypothetical protein